jgi:hypothetical protein
MKKVFWIKQLDRIVKIFNILIEITPSFRTEIFNPEQGCSIFYQNIV